MIGSKKYIKLIATGNTFFNIKLEIFLFFIKHFNFTRKIVVLLEKKCFGHWKKNILQHRKNILKVIFQGFNLSPLNGP